MKLGEVGQEIELLEPDDFHITPVRLGIRQRMASGRLIEEVISVKHTFTILYKAIEADLANALIEFYLSGRNINFIYEDSGVEKTVLVNFLEFPRSLFVYDPLYSVNVKIVLEEV